MGLLNIEQTGSGGLTKFHEGVNIQGGGGLGLLKFHEGPAIQQGSGLLSAIIRGVSKIAPKLIGAGRSALKVGGRSLQKAIKSDLAKELGKGLKDAAISTSADAAAELLTGGDVSQVLQEGVNDAKLKVASALKDKAKAYKKSNLS